MTQRDQLHRHELGEGWVDCRALASDPQSLEPPPAVKSGFGAFDDAEPFGGVPHSSITLWLGEMKVGKSRLVLALCAGYAVHGARVAYLMGEMNPREHFERLLLMSLQLTTDELRQREHMEKLENAKAWIRDKAGDRLAFKSVPITLEAIAKAAEWVGSGGIVVVDSIQRVHLAQRSNTRAEDIESAMSHIIAVADGTGAAFHLTSEMGKPPKGADIGAMDLTRGSAAPLQNCTAAYIVQRPEGDTQRIRCHLRRRGNPRDWTMVLSQRNGLPIIPYWEGGGA